MSHSSPNPMTTSVKVKICGVTEAEQAHAITAMGADYLGINFWPHSKRYLAWEKAQQWLAQLPGTIKVVGVFVNPDLELLEEMAQSGLIHGFQLHGDESSPFCSQLLKRDLRVIKAFQVRDESTLKLAATYTPTDILLDAYHPDQRGGVGETFPWELARSFITQKPDSRLWLAGGLTPENVRAAAQGVQPYAVDVASGVEDQKPGIKNLDKVTRFIQQVKES